MTGPSFFSSIRRCVRLGLALAACVAATVSTAADRATLDLDTLREQVQQEVERHYGVPAESSDNSAIAIEVGNLDPRLRLQPCDSPLNISLREPARGGNLTAKTSCDTGQRWTIYVPVRVEIYAEVAVAARTLARGHQLSSADIRFERSNIAQLSAGHIEDSERLIGMQLQRPLRSGDAFRLADLTLPQVVQRGDSVVVEAQAGSLTVVAPGKALTSGKVGQQIRVENTQSKRIIDAQIVGPGRVKVLL